jgi:hypothetical protein
MCPIFPAPTMAMRCMSFSSNLTHHGQAGADKKQP